MSAYEQLDGQSAVIGIDLAGGPDRQAIVFVERAADGTAVYTSLAQMIATAERLLEVINGTIVIPLEKAAPSGKLEGIRALWQADLRGCRAVLGLLRHLEEGSTP